MTTQASARIVLVRHGRSAHVHRGGWVDARGVRQWRDAYDLAAIDATDAPPAALRVQVAEASVVVASDLPRAIDSASRLAPGRDIRTSALLREAALPVPEWLPLRWPLAVWAVAIHLRWSYGILRGADASAEELARAQDAAAWLTELARDGSTVVAVTHGVFRRLIATRLRSERWAFEPGPRRYTHWSAWVLRR